MEQEKYLLGNLGKITVETENKVNLSIDTKRFIIAGSFLLIAVIIAILVYKSL